MTPGISHNQAVQDLISEYHAVLPPELLMNETDMLLASVLMELKAQRLSEGTTETVDVIIEQQRRDYAGDGDLGTYHSDSLEVGTDWVHIDLDFTTHEVDLRNISGPIEVAFADRSEPSNRIGYDSTESPVTGLSVHTSNVWIRSTSGATEKLDLEAWA